MAVLTMGLLPGSPALAEGTPDSPACRYDVTPRNPPNAGIPFVDHSPSGRSGHLGHALVEYAEGKLLAFYPNCSADNRDWDR